MSAYKPKNSAIWVYDFVLGGHRYHGSTGCKTRRDADAFEARERARVALKTDTGKPQIRLDDAALNYEDQLRANDKWSPDADRWIASIVDGVGADRYLSDITTATLRKHFAKRAGQVSAASVNREIEVARPIWRLHDKSHDIGDMPEWGKLFYAVTECDPRELYRDEEDRLWEALRADLHDFVRFALLSGWRLSEVIGLRWTDVSLVDRIARVKVKGGNVLARPLSEDMLVVIANQTKAGPFVFTYVCAKSRSEHIDALKRKHPARLKGERYKFSKDGWRREWAAALRLAGIDDFRFHDLRHTRGTRILRQTGNLAVAKRALGHKSIKTTLRYAHASDEDVRRGLDASESRSIPEVKNAPSEKRQKTAAD